jgi:uncharacterized membrane protein YphA (DoxX/SURF4 family)
MEIRMGSEFRQNKVVPLILRLALGAVFIYHGADKIFGEGNDFGAAWATKLWQKQGEPPADLTAKLSRLPGETPEKIKDIQDFVRTNYVREQPQVPSPLVGTIAQFAVAWGEVVGGAALLLGFLTRLAALGMVIIQAGAIYTVTGAKGFSTTTGAGYEYNVALIAMCLAIILLGGGALTVDRLLGAKPKKPS